MQQNRRDTLRCSGRVSANCGELWRIVFPSAAKLTDSLTVAVHARKKPFVYKGFNNLNTDGHGWTQIKHERKLRQQLGADEFFNAWDWPLYARARQSPRAVSATWRRCRNKPAACRGLPDQESENPFAAQTSQLFSRHSL